MKIYTKLVYEWDSEKQGFCLVSSEHYDYEGPIAKCGGGMGGGGGGSSGTQTQKMEPWDAQKPYLERGFSEAAKLFLDSTPQQYPGNTVVPYSPERETALQLQTLRALEGSPVQNAANWQVTNTLGDNYLYGNPGFNAAFESSARKIIPMVESKFENSGRTSSGLARVGVAQALADSNADLYNQERDRSLKAALVTPQLTANDYDDFDRLGAVGDARESLSQEKIADEKGRFDYDQNIRRAMLAQYMNLINGNYGGTTTTTGSTSTAGRGFSGLGALGGALSGASLGNTLGFSNPLIGAGAGLLSAFF